MQILSLKEIIEGILSRRPMCLGSTLAPNKVWIFRLRPERQCVFCFDLC